MKSFDELVTIVHEIRNKCPWDKEQTHETLKKYLIEESYEVLEAIDESNFENLSEELGDILLQILLHSELANEKNHFDINVVIEKISRKMVDRHPHVFENENNSISTKEVLENWEIIKQKEKKRESILDGVPKQLPGLIRAQRLQSKAAKIGMDWKDIGSVFSKIKEEISELEIEINSEVKEKIKAELGDVIFSLVNLGRHLDVDVEDALNQTNKKFIKRINYIESKFDSPIEITKASFESLDKLWNEAKNKTE